MSDKPLTLKVNEIFSTFQGEGPTIGIPVTFLRLAICNLHCVWCDTWYTWNFGKGDGVEKRFGSPTVKREAEVHDMTVDEIVDKLVALETLNVVISGGEPVLQQKGLKTVIERLNEKMGRRMYVEIETNGTIALDPDFEALIGQINCSPKLENSGNSKIARYKPEVLKQYQATGKAVFKFVVANEEDIREINQIAKECGLTYIMLMPQGKTKAEQEAWADKVAWIAKECGWRFSPRLHILMYDSKRGV